MPAPAEMVWLPNPPRGTQITAGFDGSEYEDWTALKCVTRGGRLFTPRYGPDRRPTIWDPAEWGGQIPRAEVDAGFTYRTDALVDAGKVRVALELPTKTPVTYPIAAVAASKQPALAREFIAYVRSAPAQAVLARFGFAKP